MEERLMKNILAAAAALTMMTGISVAADTQMKSGQTATDPAAGKSTNSDGSAGTNAAAPGTTINQTDNTGINPSAAGKSTNSDGSSGATGGSSGDCSAAGSQAPSK
jgi:hypothetical protein